MAYLDLSLIRKSISTYGENVDLEVYTSKSYSDYGDLTNQTTTISSVRAIFNTYGLNQQYNPEGALSQASYSFFFKADQTGLDIENIIVRTNGERWKITKVLQHSISGKIAVTETRVSNG